MAVFGGIVTLIGSVFLLLGALGIVRMPDVYNRMQAGTKATTLGTLLFLTGIAIGQIECMCIFRILILILFIIFTNPISSHALARAAHHIGIPLTDKSVTDALADDESEKEGAV
ncbi:MAG: monovalent cation/H(+) antiporter subunit G [Candidatus Marinimicrobia bacterium]|nr:monovalent cation/H(+) antiporter subunit G [Candidatus Neomarinimicrobiota bacterium]